MKSATDISEHLPLQRMYRWERERADQVYLTQPMGNGVVRDFTWRETMDQVRRMAAHLQSLGYAPGTHIALMSKNCAWWVMADFAIFMAGYVSVPLYPTLAAETVRQILTHSEAKLLFVGKLDDWPQMKAGVPAGLPCITFPVSPRDESLKDFPTWDDIVAKTSPLPGNPLRDAGELATIIYTSGTTGMPKGVMHSFGNFAHAAVIGHSRVQARGDDRMLSYLPMSHIAERISVELGSLRAGFRIYFAESLETFARDLARARPTLFFSVPRLWVKFQQGVQAKMPQEKLDRLLRIPLVGALVKKKILKGLGLDQCRFAGGGAAPMPPAMLNWFARLGLEILEVYGMTENCGLSHANESGKTKPGTVGTTYTGVQHRIDPATGEVQMKSAAVMQGYYKEPEKTRETFTDDGWLKTGDKGEIDSAGRLKITGRVKDLFKTSKGKYVAPAPI
ncbi:MAG TPA: AMP-binding protein, partial [Nevskiaceae bacterium]|nr:AMP-binding protein [Nevskiaceae bacterium]